MDPAPSQGRLYRRAARGVARTSRNALTLIFKLLREAYWVLDRDSKVRSQGLQTVGHVTKTEEQKHTDSEGSTYYTRHVTYEYQVDGLRHTAEKSVGDLKDLKRGVPIRVYFLPGTNPLASAIDRGARALSDGEVRGPEVSPGGAEMRYARMAKGS